MDILTAVAAVVNMISFVILAFYAWASYELQRATRASTETEREKLEQFRELYETKLAPELTANVAVRDGEHALVALHVENTGSSDARRVQLSLDPEPEAEGAREGASALRHMLDEGIDRLPAGGAFEGILHTVEAYRSRDLPMQVACHLEWEDEEGNEYDRTVLLDFAYLGALEPRTEESEARTALLAGRVDDLESEIEAMREYVD